MSVYSPIDRAALWAGFRPMAALNLSFPAIGWSRGVQRVEAFALAQLPGALVRLPQICILHQQGISAQG